MRNLKILLLLTVTPLVIFGGEIGIWTDGNKLIDKKNSAILEYQGYIMGISDLLTINKKVCLPVIKGQQLFKIVDNYLDKNPARWNETAAKLIEEALIEVYPCKI